MKPILLKIKGLNSFLEEQEIDFERLASRGLFGIFGPTGSGKSSILDAVTIALYDKIARDTGKYRDFINKEADTAFVSLKFKLGTGENGKEYTAERLYKRTDKAACKAVSARLYEKNSAGEITVLADKPTETTKETEKILGLSYEDFSRSVVLPQGKFNEFLNLAGRDRRDMLERIFRLEKYGERLTGRIKARFSQEKAALANLESKLSVYEGICQEKWEEEKLELEKIRKEKEESNKEWQEKQKQWNEKKQCLELVQEKEIFLKKKEELNKQKDSILAQEKQLYWAKKGAEIVPFLKSWMDARKNREESQEKEKEKNWNWEQREKESSTFHECHKTAYQKKEKEYPLLLKKEEELKLAVTLQKEIDRLQQERKTLLDQYHLLKKECEGQKQDWNQMIVQKEKLSSRFVQISEEKQKSFVDPDYRRMIQQGAETENKRKEWQNRREKIEEKFVLLVQEIEQEQQKKKKLSLHIEEKAELHKKEKELQQVLLTEIPDFNTKLLTITEEEIRLEGKWKEALEREKKIQAFEEQKQELDKSLFEKQEQVQRLEKITKEKWEGYKQKAEAVHQMDLSNMAGKLAQTLQEAEPCPVCGSLHHPSPAQRKTEVFLEKTEVEEAEQDWKKAQDVLSQKKLTLERMQLQAEQVKEELQKLQAAMDGVSAEEWKKQLENRKMQKKVISDDLAEMEKQQKKREQKITEMEKEMNALNASFVRTEENRSHLSKRKEELAEEKKQCNIEEEQLEKETKSIAEECHLLLSFEEECKGLTKKEAVYHKLETEEKEVRTELDKIEKKKEALGEEIKEKESKILIITTQGSEKRTVIEEKKEKIKVLTGEEEANEKALEEIKIKCSSLLREEEEARQKWELSEEARQKAAHEKSSASRERETYEKLEQKLEKELKEKEAELGFQNEEEIQKILLPSEKRVQLEQHLERYKAKWEETERNIARLDERLAGKSVNREEVEEEGKQVTELFQRKEETTSLFAVQTEKIRMIEEKLQEVAVLEQEVKARQRSTAIYEDLAKLVAGNTFVEYIAVTQLEYITKEASKRLKAITKGRYALELNNGDFIIRDDFNGGVKRRPSTLSGGESFLTSFSLALALSSKIQMTNHAPLQFFFLDEGFGTLDNQLLDVVMTSLESLHQEHLSVGIITHVEELRNRIPIKLMVEPANQGLYGTKVRLE